MIITGEGRIDRQTGHGKVVDGVARSGRKLGVPVIAIGGSLAEGAQDLLHTGLSGLEAAIVREMPLAEARSRARTYLADAAERVARLIEVGKKLNNQC